MSTDLSTANRNSPDNEIEWLSSNYIELKAEEVIECFDSSILNRACPTPIQDFAEQSKKRFGIQFRCDLDLRCNGAGHKIQGAFCRKPMGIFIDASMVGTDMFKFILAHEFGHLALHRYKDPVKCGYSTSRLNDSEKDLVTGKKLLLSPRDWMEWQANRFASAILMPRATFKDALIDFQRSALGDIRVNFGTIVLEDKDYSIRDFENAVSHLSHLYQVNRTNVKCRLRDLEILQDLGDKDAQHISQLFKEDSSISSESSVLSGQV